VKIHPQWVVTPGKQTNIIIINIIIIIREVLSALDVMFEKSKQKFDGYDTR